MKIKKTKTVEPGFDSKLHHEMPHEERPQTISIEVIQKKVSELYDIRFADMTGKRRNRQVAFPRQVAMYLSRQLTGSSFSTIGKVFGGRSCRTVINACRLVKERIETEANVGQNVHYLEKQLLAGDIPTRLRRALNRKPIEI